MKSAILSICVLFLLSGLQLNAQVQTPALSPSSELTQMVGLTEVSIEYSRPAARGRTIFAANGLVPFGSMWRTGANAATKFTFSKDVEIAGEELEAGSYAVLSKPTAEEWTVMFYNYESSSWPSYTEMEPVATVTAQTEKNADMVESFTIDISDIDINSANINMKWENTMVSLPLAVNTEAQVQESIESTMAGPTTNDYYAAAQYYQSTGQNLETALEYVQKVNTDNPRFWTLRLEATILADLKKFDEAIAVAKKSKEMAMEAGNQDFVRMNEKSIETWEQM